MLIVTGSLPMLTQKPQFILLSNSALLLSLIFFQVMIVSIIRPPVSLREKVVRAVRILTVLALFFAFAILVNSNIGLYNLNIVALFCLVTINSSLYFPSWKKESPLLLIMVLIFTFAELVTLLALSHRLRNS